MSPIDPQTKELLDRTRRIETRLTAFLQSQGVDVQTQPCTWTYGTVHVPSRAVPLASILNVIPDTYNPEFSIKLQIGADTVGYLYRGIGP